MSAAWLIDHWQSLVDTVALAIVVAACVIHYAENLSRHNPTCEVLGFVMTGAGAFGDAVYHWTKKAEPFNFELLMHVGMAFIAVSLIQGHLRAVLSRVPGFGLADRRTRT